MGIISGETDRLIHLVEELLDFSRLQSNHFNLYKQKVQLYDILEETIWQLTPKSEEKEIQFTTIDRIELMGDRNRLKQVFLNIVQNAIKYSHKSTIHIEATKIEGQAVIKVRDEGIGIAKEHLPYIEQSFYQINNHCRCRYWFSYR